MCVFGVIWVAGALQVTLGGSLPGKVCSSCWSSSSSRSCRSRRLRTSFAVCDVAQRIIGKLKGGAAVGGVSLLGAGVGNGAAAHPPTPAMKRFADSLVRQKGIKPPPGYKTSISICRKFLSEHAPKRADGETAGKLETKPVSPAQLLYAKKIPQGKDLVIPDEAKASSTTMSAWIHSNRDTKRRRRGRKAAYKASGPSVPQSAGLTKRSRKRKARADAAPSTPAQPNSITGTPLRFLMATRMLR